MMKSETIIDPRGTMSVSHWIKMLIILVFAVFVMYSVRHNDACIVI